MKAVAKCARGSDLSANTLTRLGVTPRINFHLTIGREYIVYAMLLSNTGLNFLVMEDNGLPRWKAIELFDVIDGKIPPHWEFLSLEDQGQYQQVFALWAYPAMIQNRDHFDALAEGEGWALAEFKNEVDSRLGT
ncbi:hypothetical protein Aple_039780 [Acrocarpospora pleiomorpha]|uniref:Uncharacterized protein n=1 Tax=Acrocarpospora pleiomorpha TaxID=90975 RepID=A0A5M3XJT1_9ACTN|nr:hypothetical protein [Acrocarpospora pleiomorpha]GES21082.1 hypothetical protein Aple_039780 [Acrocarpospora pleiomorpha]